MNGRSTHVTTHKAGGSKSETALALGVEGPPPPPPPPPAEGEEGEAQMLVYEFPPCGVFHTTLETQIM
jgi:hypothetical protein